MQAHAAHFLPLLLFLPAFILAQHIDDEPSRPAVQWSLVLCSFVFLSQFPFAHRFTSRHRRPYCALPLPTASYPSPLPQGCSLSPRTSRNTFALHLSRSLARSRLFEIAASRPQELLRNSPLGLSDLAPDTASVLPTSRWSKGKHVALTGSLFKFSRFIPNVSGLGRLPDVEVPPYSLKLAERTTISTISDIVGLSAFLSLTK